MCKGNACAASLASSLVLEVSSMDRKLIASVALFGELYDQDRDIYDVIAALLKAAVVLENRWAFDTTEATDLLDSIFGFQLPEAVVRTTLRNRLKNKEKVVRFEHGVYTFLIEELSNTDEFESELQGIVRAQDGIFDQFVTYANAEQRKKNIESDTEELRRSLANYLLDDEVPEAHSRLISTFIINHENDEAFHRSLNAVREGLVLYDGIRYSPDVRRLGSWLKQLTVYLDTEVLFDAAGLNGTLFKQLFDDFYSLVREVNRARKGAIQLMYFPESRDEIEKFFYVSELIILGKVNLNPSKTAQVEIVSGCKKASDVLKKKAALYAELTRRRIRLCDRGDYYSAPEFVVEGTGVVNELRRQAKKDKREFDLEACSNTLKMFTKINCLREGDNKGLFPEVRHILLSGKSYTRYLSFHPLIRPENSATPFSIDLEHATNRLWFYLEKGLAKSVSTPRSLDVVAKAQVVLSSQINNSVARQYEALNERFAKGAMTSNEAEYLNHELRRYAARPEELTSETIESHTKIIDYEDFEMHLREKSRLERVARQGEEASKELAEIKEHQKEQRAESKRRIAKAKTVTLAFGLALLVVLVLLASIVLIVRYRTDSDSPLAMFGLVFSVASVVYPAVKFRALKRWLTRKYEEWAQEE